MPIGKIDFILLFILYILYIFHLFSSRELSAELKLMAVLRLLACGNFQQTAADYIGVSQPTVCRILPEVCDAILEHFDSIVYMPRNQAECLAKASAFAEIAGMPRCVGAIDCTHVKIASPGGEVVSEIKKKRFFFLIKCTHFFPERKLSQ